MIVLVRMVVNNVFQQLSANPRTSPCIVCVEFIIKVEKPFEKPIFHSSLYDHCINLTRITDTKPIRIATKTCDFLCDFGSSVSCEMFVALLLGHTKMLGLLV